MPVTTLNNVLRTSLSTQVKAWEERVAILNRDMAIMAEEVLTLQKAIAHAQGLLGFEKKDTQAQLFTKQDLPPLSDGIASIMADGVPRKPGDIRPKLIERGYDEEKVSSHSPVFYNTLTRLVARGVLLKNDDGEYVSASLLKAAQ